MKTKFSTFFVVIVFFLSFYFVKGQDTVLVENFEMWPPQGWTLKPDTGLFAWSQNNGKTAGPGKP
ncbi:MAG: hypothetical protein RR328_04525 [Bacteroidales bacterium]